MVTWSDEWLMVKIQLLHPIVARITKEKSGLVKIKKDPFLNLLWPGLQMKTYQRLAGAGTSTVVADR